MNSEQLLAMIFLAWIFFSLIGNANGHDSEQWIANKALHDPVSGTFCCGPSDCRVLADNEVKEVKGGFQVNMHVSKEYQTTAIQGQYVISEFIPYARTLPFADDGHYHACVRWTNDDATLLPNIRCFIVPPGSS